MSHRDDLAPVGAPQDPAPVGALQDLAPVGAAEYAAIERRLARTLGVQECLVLQGEAMLALEAVARGLGRPGSRALNVVTGPYGEGFGRWLAHLGVEVESLVVPFDRAVAAGQVREALAAEGRFDLLSVVHAEAATGAVNPLGEIAEAARGAGALTVVDAVASVGAEPLAIAGWGLDVVVVSAQKALAGPAGVTGVVVSAAAWEAMAANRSAPRDSALSLLDWKERWIDTDRSALPSIPGHLETRALLAALDRVDAEGLPGVVARHAAARDACRAGVRALGLDPWVRDDAEAAAVATTVAVPDGLAARELAEAVTGAAGGGLRPAVAVAPASLAERALRVSHTGRRATTADVVSAIAALGLGLSALGVRCDPGGAVVAALSA